MKSNLNLNDVKGTYAKLISDNYNNLKSIYDDEDKDVDDLKEAVENCTNSAKDTDAYRGFRQALDTKRSKDEILFYITNITLNANHLSANPNSKWRNERF